MTGQAHVRQRRSTVGGGAATALLTLMLLGCENPTPSTPPPDPGRADAARSDGVPRPPPVRDAAGTDLAPPARADAGDSGVAPGAPGLAPRPTRLVVLGDSITACSNLGSKQDPGCSPYKLHQYLGSSLAPGIIYDNQATGGAVTADVPAQQTARIGASAGHALVLIFVGGNDLRSYLLADDRTAEAGYQMTLPRIRESWTQIFADLGDRTRFPQGATVVMNNQYNPWDGCTAFPYFLSARKNQLLAAYNTELQAIATAHGAQLVDQFTPYLGHGHHYNVRSCPHYLPGAAPFMGDLIHPNRAGHEHLFQQWKKVVDRLYGG